MHSVDLLCCSVIHSVINSTYETLHHILSSCIVAVVHVVRSCQYCGYTVHIDAQRWSQLIKYSLDTFVRYSIYLLIFKSQKGSIEALSFLIYLIDYLRDYLIITP